MLGPLSPQDLSQTFNCGIGYIVVCPEDKADEIAQNLKESGESVSQIGRVSERADGEPAIIMHDLDKNWSS